MESESKVLPGPSDKDLPGPPDMGLLIRDGEGNYYFLRPEFLEACKVPKEEVEGVKRLGARLGKPEESKDIKRHEAEVIGSLKISKPLEDMDQDLAERLRATTATTTYMCPW
jgi:hypothetical protein